MNKRAFIILVAVLVVAVFAVLLYLFVFSADRWTEPEYVEFALEEPFYVNVYDGYGILKTGIVLILNSNETSVMSLMRSKTPQIRDTLISALRSISVSILSDPQRYDEVKRALVDALNAALTDARGEPLNVIHGIYFTDYYLQ